MMELKMVSIKDFLWCSNSGDNCFWNRFYGWCMVMTVNKELKKITEKIFPEWKEFPEGHRLKRFMEQIQALITERDKRENHLKEYIVRLEDENREKTKEIARLKWAYSKAKEELRRC